MTSLIYSANCIHCDINCDIYPLIAVSGAHNTIVTARAGKDLVSSLVSGLLTIVSTGLKGEQSTRCLQLKLTDTLLQTVCASPYLANAALGIIVR